ncbi:hypothetical protein SAMN04488130_106110 [Flavobacterium urumqiense]|uniref:Uncharacterized protein n=1 Tax=Flavobacterium urumqiense TaxID=935224 RepID=A0A1H5XMC2_9FLAO|nr:hypothetical protein SAMN04488130_106110 [Flavobacterium urumqiense]
MIISKQTTLYCIILEDKNQNDLLLSWNDKQNPSILKKILR